MADLRWQIQRQGSLVRVRFAGEIDLACVARFESAVEDAFKGSEIIVLDLSGVPFLDSSGLRSLLRVRDLAEGAGKRLFVGDMSRQVERVFRQSGVDRYIEGGQSRSSAPRRSTTRRPWV